VLVAPSPKLQLQAFGAFVLVSVKVTATPVRGLDGAELKLAVGAPGLPGPTTTVSVGGVEDSRDASDSELPVVVREMLSGPPWAPAARPVIERLTGVPLVRGPGTEPELTTSRVGALAYAIVVSPQVESPTRQTEKPEPPLVAGVTVSMALWIDPTTPERSNFRYGL
jgi:hypothetical protein